MASKKTAERKTTQTIFWRRVLISGFLASVLLVIANSAYWANRTIFDTDTFTSIAVGSITSESSRQAIASEVVDRALGEQPIVKQIAGPTATKLVSSLLGTEQFTKVLEVAVGKLQVYLTSSNQESIVIDLSGVKSTFENLINLAGRDNTQAQAKISSVPDQITLINADNIPDFYKYGVALLWIAPLTAIGALALLVYPYIRDRSRYYIIAATQGALLIVVGYLCLLVGPLFKPPVLANIPSANSRVVVSNLYDAFINTFNSQSLVLVKIGFALALIPLAFRYGLKFYGNWAAKKKSA